MTTQAIVLCTLEELRDHAATKPDTVFDLASCTNCLAVQVTGRRMYDHWFFVGFNARVPQAFGDLCHDACALEKRFMCGSEVARAIGSILSGSSPVEAALDAVGFADERDAV